MRYVFRIFLISTFLAFPAVVRACPYGAEFQINSSWQGDQVFPAVAVLTDGGYIVCWHSPDDSGFGVFCQMFDADNSRVGGEFRANTTTQDDQLDPVVAGMSGGGFVVVWTSRYQDGSEYGVFGQVFDKDGKKAGDEFQVNSTIYDIQYDPAVSALSGGGFVACWQSLHQDGDDFGCFGQMFDAAGQKRGSEFQINTYTAGLQGDPVPALLKNGDFVVCWTNQFVSINGQIFDGNGNRKGPEFLVNSAGQGPCWWIAVTPLTFGGFAVFWNDRSEGSYDVFGRRFDGSANRLGDEFRVNTTLQGDQWKSSAAPQPDGGFFVCWQSDGQDGSDQGIFAQFFDGEGNRKWREFQVNSTTAGSQDFSAVASFPDGGFTACWEGADQDGSGYGIFGKRYPGARFAHPLSNFRLIEPANDASIETDSILFRWHFPGAAREIYPWEVSFNLYLDTLPDFSHPIVVRGIQDTTLTLGHPQKGRTYFWMVLAKSIDGDSLWSWNANGFFIGYGTPDDEDDQEYLTGEEFRVNTCTDDWKCDPSVAALPGGGFVACWTSGGQDGSGYGIYGQLFDAKGKKANGEFRVNTHTEANQSLPNVAALAGGGFVVCWSSIEQIGMSAGIYGQAFDALGEKVNDEFRVDTHTNEWQWDASVAALPGGGFVVCWWGIGQDGSNHGVYGQVFDGSGKKTGVEFQMNTCQYDWQSYPSVTALTEGGFVVCWDNRGQGDFSLDIHGQVFDTNREKKGTEFRVNTYTEYQQVNPSVSALPGGGFVVCWMSNEQDGSGYGVYGQVFDASGEKENSEIQVNTCKEGDQRYPIVSALPEGGFVVVWMSSGQDGSECGVYGQVFDASGEKENGEFRVNTHTEKDQREPSVAAFPGGGFVVCWISLGQDGLKAPVYAKRFAPSTLLHILNPFVLICPAEGDTLNSTHTDLVWRQPVSQVVSYLWQLHYKIYIDNDPDFQSPQVLEQDQDTTLTIQNLQPGKTYFWKVLVKNTAGDSLWSSNMNVFSVAHDAISGVEEEMSRNPDRFALHPNYPNPFNPETSIRFDLPSPSFVKIMIYDIQGRPVRTIQDECRNAGVFSSAWDGKDEKGYAAPSGIYVCRMEAKSLDGRRFVQSVKMGLVR